MRQVRSPVGVKSLRHDDCVPDAELLDSAHTAGGGREAFTILQQCLARSAELPTDAAHHGDLVVTAAALPVAGQEQPVNRPIDQQPQPGTDSFVQHQRGASVRHHARAEHDGHVAMLQTARIGDDPAKGSRSHESAAHRDRPDGRTEGDADAGGDRANGVPAKGLPAKGLPAKGVPATRRSITDGQPHGGTVPPISASQLRSMSSPTIPKQPLFALALTMSTTYDGPIGGECGINKVQRVTRVSGLPPRRLSSGPRNLGP